MRLGKSRVVSLAHLNKRTSRPYNWCKAVTTPCNPLYFAIPVAVAASTSLVLPTSGVGIAVLCNMIDVGPLQLLLNGFAVKITALIMILLTVNLNSDLHRLPDWMFSESQNYTAAFSY
ncbi:uncharacterized protein LOC144102406 [Amblyomma americanum]